MALEELAIALTSDLILERAFLGPVSASSSTAGFFTIFFATAFFGVGFLADEKSLGLFILGLILRRFPSSSVSRRFPALTCPAN